MKKYKNYLIILILIVSFLVGVCFIPVGISKFIPLIEQQVEADLGVKIHVDKLIMRVGPSIKIKAPIMHIMYSDGRKFAQLDNVKFYISWASMIKDSVKINNLKANKLTVRIDSEDKEFFNLINKLEEKDFVNSPNISLKEYSITYNNKELSEKYVLEGHTLDLNKILQYKNYKIKTIGSFIIDNQKYISYDINCLPLIEIKDNDLNIDFYAIIKQLKELAFYSDVIADVKLFKTKNSEIQASGFINIDNMSVLDPLKKNPKSFIYLTLWGDKASILSNIYTSMSKKVYVEGMINNSKKPIIDLKVKTDDINLSDLHQKLKILTSFSVLKNINTLAGTLNADFTLKGDINKIKSNGFLRINNANVKANGIEIDNITSDIDFSNNVLNIVNTTGYVNKSPIFIKGKYAKEIDIELLMNKVDLKYLTPSVFGVKSGVASVVANFKGTIDNITHKEKVLIDNLNIENKDINMSIESFNIDTNKNNVAYISNIKCKTPHTSLIKVPSLKLFIDSNNIKVPETNIFMANSMLSIKAEINDYNKDFIFNSVVSGYVNSKDFVKYNNYSTRLPLKLIINGNKFVQNINSQVLIENSALFEEPTVVNLLAKFDKNNIKIDDLSLVGYSGKDFSDYKIISKLPKKMTITGNIDNIREPIFKNIRIFIPQQLNLHLLDSILHLKGDLFVNGNIEKPEIIGQLSLQNLINQNLQLAVTNATVDFNKNNAILSAPTVKLADTSLGINAVVSTDISNGLLINALSIKSKFLNTDTLLMYKDTPLINILPVTIKNAKIYSERVLSNIYNAQIYLSALNTEMDLINDVITLKNLSAELYNGKLAGALEFNLKDEHFKSNLMARGVSAAPIFDIISTRKDSISGTMDFDSTLNGNLTSKQSLSGDIKFVVNNGRMSTLGKLEHLLYAQNVIADNMLRTSLSVVTKAITLKDTGLFKYLRGDVTLNDGIAYINMLQSQGPLMSLFIKGQFNPINDYAQLAVLGRLSDEIVSGLGAFADFSFKKLLVMLTGEDNKFSILPEDYDKIPQLPMKNTKEFRSIINGIVDKPSSVILFNWIAYSQKSFKQKEIPITDTKVPDFVEELPY